MKETSLPEMSVKDTKVEKYPISQPLDLNVHLTVMKEMPIEVGELICSKSLVLCFRQLLLGQEY